MDINDRNSNAIFTDRRNNTGRVHRKLCRRNRNRAETMDPRPWWLKVNYLGTQEDEKDRT